MTVAMRYISALKLNGSPDPGKNPACHRKFANLIGTRAVTTYVINPESLMMSAKTNFASQTYDLNALGLAGQYAFGQFSGRQGRRWAFMPRPSPSASSSPIPSTASC